MRLQIYVPAWQADRWNEDTSMTHSEFLSRLSDLAGGYTVTQGMGGYKNLPPEPVLIVEALLRDNEMRGLVYSSLWTLLRLYATELIAQGEKSVLIVQDNEPTFITQ